MNDASEHAAAPTWTGSTIASLVVSVLCMAPTAATLLLVAVTIIAPVLITAPAAVAMNDHQLAESGGILLAIGAAFSMVASFPIAITSVLLHPVGAATAWFARQRGARRSGLVLLIAHGVTFLAGAGVLLFWSSWIVESYMSR